MDLIRRDLNNWIPLLLRVWRKHRRTQSGPTDRLTTAEAFEVTQGVRRLSQGLTGERDLAGERYLSDPILLGAYLLYFWPVSYAQARHALRDLDLNSINGRPGAVAPTVLDLGSGPGPLGFACFDLGAHSVTFVDRSRAATALAGELAQAAGYSAVLYHWDPLRSNTLPQAKFDLITAGHVLNELWSGHPERIQRRAELVAKWFERLKPSGYLFLQEPALTSTSRDLLAVRDRLLEQGHTLVSPCLWQRACPALAKPEDTCHDEFAWSPPPLILDIIRRAGFQKKTLKMTEVLFPAAPRSAAAPDLELFRIVSEPMISKNQRIRLLGCGPAGRLSLALKPDLATDDNRCFLTLRRGDLISVRNAKPREGGGLTLEPGSRVEILRRA